MFVTMKNVVDSRGLYMELARYNLNVTDLGTEVLVYGDVYDVANVLAICRKWGDIIEQTQEEET